MRGSRRNWPHPVLCGGHRLAENSRTGRTAYRFVGEAYRLRLMTRQFATAVIPSAIRTRVHCESLARRVETRRTVAQALGDNALLFTPEANKTWLPLPINPILIRHKSRNPLAKFLMDRPSQTESAGVAHVESTNRLATLLTAAVC